VCNNCVAIKISVLRQKSIILFFAEKWSLERFSNDCIFLEVFITLASKEHNNQRVNMLLILLNNAAVRQQANNSHNETAAECFTKISLHVHFSWYNLVYNLMNAAEFFVPPDGKTPLWGKNERGQGTLLIRVKNFFDNKFFAE